VSSAFDDDEEPPAGLEDPTIDCYTHFVMVEILLPGTSQPTLTHDVEVIASRQLSTGEAERLARLQVQPWIDTLANSPRFAQRFGTAPVVRLTATGSVFGC
jgi:hypothetical protein